MAQELNGAEDDIVSSAIDAGMRAGDIRERRSPWESLFWSYPGKVDDITWSETIGKEARGLDGFDLGRVQAVDPDFVRTEKGLIRKDAIVVPRNLVQAFDGSTLWFGVEAGPEGRYKRTNSPIRDDL